MFAMPIAPTSSATAPSPSSSVVNWPLAAARASRMSEGRLTSTPEAFCGSAVGASRFETSTDVVDVRPDVDLRRVRLQLEQSLGDGQADERGRIERRVEDRGFHDPDDVEPGIAEVHHHMAADVVDLEDARRLVAEHHLREARTDGIEELP